MGHAGETERRPEAILIAGPTASGKSALAIRLATRLGGLVINADSMQVYRDLRIITARPTHEDECRAPHALFGTVDGGVAYSVSAWLADAATQVRLAREAELTPIVVGGTGLYFKALTQGLSAIPKVPVEVRAEIRAWAAGRAPGVLHAALAACDQLMAARLLPTDPQRIIRALEVHRATGRSLASFQSSREPPSLDLSRCEAISLGVDRAELRDRLDRRFDAMMQEGALDEVGRLAERRLDPASPVMRALGVPPLLHHLTGQLDLESAITQAKSDTRRYVKRQETFVRHQLPGFRQVPPDQAERLVLAGRQLA